MAAHALTDHYRGEREQLIELGRTINAQDASMMTLACPEWSVKDVYAHLAGIATDILAGNTEGAATAPWADQHVSDRRDQSLTAVLDEWSTNGAEVSTVMASIGEAFPYLLFIDQYTHGWDIRAAIGERAAVTPNLTAWRHFADDVRTTLESDPAGADLDAITLQLSDGGFTQSIAIGTGEPVGTVAMPLFEFSRAVLGRRSIAQLTRFDWPVADPTGHIHAIVRFGITPDDLTDPVLLT